MLVEEEENDRDVFENAYFEITANIRCLTSSSSNLNNLTNITPSATPFSTSESNNHVRLPKLNLPKFSGKYEDWFLFYDTFNSVINVNQELSCVQKFQYLKSAVTGEASDIIQSLELLEQNYEIAWNLLKQRYDNKSTVVNAHLRALFELPSIAKKNASEL